MMPRDGRDCMGMMGWGKRVGKTGYPCIRKGFASASLLLHCSVYNKNRVISQISSPVLVSRAWGWLLTASIQRTPFFMSGNWRWAGFNLSALIPPIGVAVQRYGDRYGAGRNVLGPVRDAGHTGASPHCRSPLYPGLGPFGFFRQEPERIR